MFRGLAIVGPWLSLAVLAGIPRGAAADVILDFGDVPPGTLAVFNPYVSQGFELTSTAGGFVFNSPDAGNGSPQPPGNNPFYAGANGLASFVPATITLTRQDAQPFSLLGIDLARNFAFDPPPTTTFTGALTGGGTVTQTFTVTSPSPPLAFQSFALTGFGNVTSVTWTQGASTEGIHQFSHVHLAAVPVAGVPEPSTGALALLAVVALVAGSMRQSAMVPDADK